MDPLQPIHAKSVPSFGRIWLLTVIGATIIFPVISVLFINYYKTEDPAWIDLLYRQKEIALERRSSQPHRLIIVGGSGALFGIDAELIEKKLHIPTVNFATHAGLGLRYLLDRAKRELRPGDVLLLSPEYETWADSYRDTEGPAFDYIWTYDKSYLARMNPIESAKMISAVPWSQWPRSAEGWLDRLHGDYFHFRELSFYSVATLDLNGGIHATNPSAKSEPSAFALPTDAALPSMRAIREFGSYAQSRGIRLLFAWPSIARPRIDLNDETFLTKFLLDSGFTVLGAPRDSEYSPDWFMDTPYHPNPCCRRIRTEELIRRLRPLFGLPAAIPEVLGVFLLAGEDHQLTGGNIFADDPNVIFRYLRPDLCGYGILPKRVAELVRGGVPVYTDSDDARPLLDSVGLTLALQSHQTQTVSEWFAQYPKAIFCVAIPQNYPLAIPDVIRGQLSSGVAIFGPGIAPIFGNEINEKRLQPDSIPCVVSLHTAPQAQITVDDREFLSSPTGICVLAIDPEMGIVLGKAIFTSSPSIETWRLYRATDRTASGRAL